MKPDKITKEQGTKTVLNFLSSKVFFYLPLVFIFIPLFLVLMILKSKTIATLLILEEEDISLILPGIVFIALIVIADCTAVLAMHKLYNSSFSINNQSDKNISVCFTFLQVFSLIFAIIFAFSTILLFFGIANDTDSTFSGLFSIYNQDKQFISWNTKFFMLLILLAINFLFCVGLTRWILSVEKTFKTDKIYVNGTAFLNNMAIANCVIIFVNLIIMLIELDWFFVLFLLSMFVFNIAIIFNTMKYFKLCNKSLATQYDDYIAELHEDKEIEYYDTFAQRTDEIAPEETFSKEKPYQFDVDFKNFEFYISKKVEEDNQKDTHISGTCPVCQALLHEENICPKCGYVIYKPFENE